jgi:hypothetical protein
MHVTFHGHLVLFDFMTLIIIIYIFLVRSKTSVQVRNMFIFRGVRLLGPRRIPTLVDGLICSPRMLLRHIRIYPPCLECGIYGGQNATG